MTESAGKQDSVRLSPLLDAELPTLFRWINDREQVLFNAAFNPVSEIQHRAWFENILRQPDVVLFAIRAGERLIGSCQLHSIHPVHRSAELQIRLGETETRGKGFGTEAVRQLVEFGFRDRNLERIQVHVFADNIAALKVYKKVGFVREGLLRQAAYIDGRWLDVVVMGLLRADHGQS